MKASKKISTEYIESFLDIQSVGELAVFVNLRPAELEYFLFYAPEDKKYYSFDINKKKGGTRTILAPSARLKGIQKILQVVFQYLYNQKPSVHGFINDKSIVTNATIHLRRKILVNIDLKDFFPSIKFSRIRGVFMKHPFGFERDVATALAKLCCFKDYLPQGAPTSPILSNFVCRNLDNSFMKFSKLARVTYTRYADDISISTNLKELPSVVGLIKGEKLIISDEIKKIIQRNSFHINMEKVRYALQESRQEVTGVIVNKKLNVYRSYIRHVKSMLHAWEVYGLSRAAIEHFTKFNPKHYMPVDVEMSFVKELTGKINHIGRVRGRDDQIYASLYARIKLRAPDVKLTIIHRKIENAQLPVILTEGKSDIKHMKAALSNFKNRGLYMDLHIHLPEYGDEINMSNGDLKKCCESYSTGLLHNNIVICVFDRDVKTINSKVTSTEQSYKSWGNKVFSMVLPIPTHRPNIDVCIEQYYTDEEIKTYDQQRRRLYLSGEFDRDSGKHHTFPLTLKYKSIAKATHDKIIDTGVMNLESKNVALSKNAFSEYIFRQEPGFNNFNFDGFIPLFDLIQKIIKESSKPSQSLIPSAFIDRTLATL